MSDIKEILKNAINEPVAIKHDGNRFVVMTDTKFTIMSEEIFNLQKSLNSVLDTMHKEMLKTESKGLAEVDYVDDIDDLRKLKRMYKHSIKSNIGLNFRLGNAAKNYIKLKAKLEEIDKAVVLKNYGITLEDK